MYKVYLDNELLYCPSVSALSLEALSLNLELNATNVCEFSILPENPCYEKIKKRKSIIKVYDDGYRVFRGIVQDSKRDFLNGLQVTCEGELAFLRDSIQRTYAVKGTVEAFFAFLIREHNKQMDGERQFKIGRCTVKASEEEMLYEDSQYMNTWENLQKNLLDAFGGYLWTREEEDGVYIDYLEDFETLNQQRVEFGKNLLDFEESVKGAEIKTAIIPLGCKVKTEEEGEAERRLDITSVNDGLDYVFSEEAVEKYGLIFETVVWDEVNLPEELLQKGKEELKNYIHLAQSIEIQAVNLHQINQDIRSYRLGQYTRVVSRPHRFDEVLLTRKLDLDLLDPASGTLHLGVERKSFVDRQEDDKDVVHAMIERVESDFELNKDRAEQHLGESINQVYENVYSAIKQASDSVMIQVGEECYLKADVDEMVKSMNTEYRQLSDRFEFHFREFVENLEGMKTDTDEKFQDVLKYIHFQDGSIMLGQTGNAFQLRITNNRIQFLENNVEVAYIADRKIYITDGEFINSLKIGSFAFRPRKNGNLSFGKVV